MKKPKPEYKVVIGHGCKACGHGTTWYVKDSEDSMWTARTEVYEVAMEQCAMLNTAFERGKKAK